MQSKKRAKAVKFGDKAKSDVSEKEAALKKIEEEAEEIKKRVQQLEKDETGEPEEDPKASVQEDNTPADAQPTQLAAQAHVLDDGAADSDSDAPEEDATEQSEHAHPAENEGVISDEVQGAGPVSGESAEQNVATQNEDVSESTPATVGQDGEFFNAPPDAYEKGSSFPYFLKVAIITFLLGVAFIAGGYYVMNNESLRARLPLGGAPTPTKAAVTPEPTEAPVDLSKYTIRVLNGTGRSGEAATVQASLESAGFEVVSVGNASGTDFDVTEITAAEEVEVEFLDKLKEELSKSYEVGEVERVASGAADVVVTLGGELKQ